MGELFILIAGGFLGAWFSRKEAKKLPKTTERAKAYGDYVEAILTHQKPTDEVIARIMVYGESKVVRAVSSGESLAEIIIQMRISLETGEYIKSDLEKIIATHESFSRMANK